MKKFVLPLACGFLITGCSHLWPSLKANDPASVPQRIEIQPSQAEKVGGPTYNKSSKSPSPLQRSASIFAKAATTKRANAVQRAAAAGGGSTGTFVGNKVTAMRGDLGKLNGRIADLNTRMRGLRDETAASSQKYHALTCLLYTSPSPRD